MLELVVLAEELEAEAAGEAAAAVVPDSPLTLYTFGVPEDTVAGVALQALLAVTDPGLAVVTDSSDHLGINKVLTPTRLTSLLLPSAPGTTRLHASGVVAGVFDDTITSLHHALLFPALRTHRQPLETLTEETEGAVLLCAATLITLHDGVTGPGHDTLVVSLAGDLLLSDLHLLGLPPLPSFLFRHF